jgi:cell wall-associated NlpC family hydrolase
MLPDRVHEIDLWRECRRNDIILVARTWVGVPYKLGGHSARQIDCSHFVNEVYRFAVDRTLPYLYTGDLLTSDLFMEVAEPAKGDLVLWPKHGKTLGHVGIVINPAAGTFIGAQKSTGVAESNYLTNPYWGTRGGRTFRRHVSLY